MTDIGPAEVEPDDNESAVRLMAYADRFEIEGIITTIGWNCDPYPADWAKYLDNVIDKYEADLMKLAQRPKKIPRVPGTIHKSERESTESFCRAPQMHQLINNPKHAPWNAIPPSQMRTIANGLWM